MIFCTRELATSKAHHVSIEGIDRKLSFRDLPG